MNAVRHQKYVVKKLCVQMHRGPSIARVQTDFTLQLGFCGLWGFLFVRVSIRRSCSQCRIQSYSDVFNELYLPDSLCATIPQVLRTFSMRSNLQRFVSQLCYEILSLDLSTHNVVCMCCRARQKRELFWTTWTNNFKTTQASFYQRRSEEKQNVATTYMKKYKQYNCVSS